MSHSKAPKFQQVGSRGPNKQTWLQALFHPRQRATRVLVLAPPSSGFLKMPKLVNLTLVRCHPPAVNFTPQTSLAENCHSLMFYQLTSILPPSSGSAWFSDWFEFSDRGWVDPTKRELAIVLPEPSATIPVPVSALVVEQYFKQFCVL